MVRRTRMAIAGVAIASGLAATQQALPAAAAPARLLPGHSVSGDVQPNGTWFRGQVVRTATSSSVLNEMDFTVSDLPGCCLDIRIREASGNEYLRSEIDNIQSTGSWIWATEHPSEGGGTSTRNFRIWSRNSVVGSDTHWAGTFYY